FSTKKYWEILGKPPENCALAVGYQGTTEGTKKTE
ncbi:hypothetical protein EVA_20308, partial [gut metagenome]